MQHNLPELQLEEPTQDFWFPPNQSDFLVKYAIGDEKFKQVTDCLLDKSKAKNITLNDTLETDVKVRFGSGAGVKTANARGLITSSSKGEFVSASLRLSNGDKTPNKGKGIPVNKSSALSLLPPENRLESEFAFSPDAVGDCILNKLGLIGIPEESNAKGSLSYTDESPISVSPNHSGLIVIAGGTGTGKSLYAHAIVLRWLLRIGISGYLASLANGGGYVPPHLVTFEDPIEPWTLFDGSTDNRFNLDSSLNDDLSVGLRLTARAKLYDVYCLEDACKHSLRQNPKLIYIGECRSSEEWNLAIELGGTGHLVVTTCHASSLVETFTKLAGPSQRDAQSRRILANSLLGVIHLQRHPVNVPPFCKDLDANQTFSQMWRNTPESISNFVADGLSSLIPDAENVFSRKTMAESILKLQREGKYDVEQDDSKDKLDVLNKMVKASAHDMDMRGL